MSASTLLLYTKQTGHVLAAATVAAPLSGTIDPKTLAGDLLPVRHLGDPSGGSFVPGEATVPADQLAALSVDAKAAPIEQAHTLVVKPDKTLEVLDFTKFFAPPSAVASTGFTIKFTALSTEKTTVWVHVEPASAGGPTDTPPPPQTVSVDVTPQSTATNATTVSVPLQSLPTGDYWALVLIRGFVPMLSKIHVP